MVLIQVYRRKLIVENINLVQYQSYKSNYYQKHFEVKNNEELQRRFLKGIIT